MGTINRKNNRLPNYNYSTPGAYFITICTEERKNYFWLESPSATQDNLNICLTPLGLFVSEKIREISSHYPAVSVDHYVIMPNHIHLLLQIHAASDRRSVIAPTVSTVVRQLKGLVSKQAGCPIWQKGFYDHIVRSDTDYQRIWTYIEENPVKWAEDSLFIPLSRT